MIFIEKEDIQSTYRILSLMKEIDVSRLIPDGFYPLHSAAKTGNVLMVVLIKVFSSRFGGEQSLLSLRDEKGKTALDVSLPGESFDFLSSLYE